MHAPLEIERKYLIKMPNTASLAAMEGARIFAITQTYLCAPTGLSRRVRKKTEGEKTTYVLTEKERVSPMTAIERERELTPEEYALSLVDALPTATPIEKVRYAIPYARHTLAIDVYPFWETAAILEIELSSEDEEITLPPFLSVVCEVTDDGRFKNAALAQNAAKRALLPHLIAPKTL